MTPVRTAAAHLPRAIAFGKFDEPLRLTKRNEFGILFWFTEHGQTALVGKVFTIFG
jgi:hypothetical protein